MGIRILDDKCTGCTLCVRACPFAAITMNEVAPAGRAVAVIGPECTLCGACVPVCKFDAIELIVEQRKPVDRDKYRNVWVVAEQKRGVVQSVTYELLGAGRGLADKRGSELHVVLMGQGMNGACNELIARGADVVHYMDGAAFADYQDEPYSRVLCRLMNKYKPEIVLCGATAIGRSLIPRVAVQINTGLTADCTGLEISDEGGLMQIRPAFGGNIMATILTPNHRPQMATVRHKVMKEAKVDPAHTGRIIAVEPVKGDEYVRAKVVEFVEELESTVNLAEADIIVSGGRGLGTPEGFKLVEQLALALGGAVGSSRAAVDAGWIPYSHQVGQTGKTVCPKLYVACGISGQIQHLVGMQSSDTIVAINKDREAPIFSVADYGVVGDLYQVIPAIIDRINAR
ncbi:MAG: electron transfer flavoprotein subunit alpha [Verrucomicrobia bacterium]|nr:electron transfer flavoprotein subunit alpha [Verrucomicrobiota bacterium]